MIETDSSGRRARTREAIVGAAMRLLAERPIDAIAVDDIVRAAGVAKGSFYNHFADKEALAGALARTLRAQVEAEVGTANAGVEDPAQRVARALCVYLRRAVADPKAAMVLLRLGAQAPAAGAPLNRGVADDVAAGLVGGRFALPTAEAGVLFILGVAQASLARALGEGGGALAPSLGQQMGSLLLRGFGLPPAEADAVAARAAHDLLGRQALV
jgi:AcrR family transcriptional regulator